MEKLGLLYTLLGTLCLAGIFVLSGTLENGLFLPDEAVGYQQFVLSSPMGIRGQVLSKYCACLLISLLGGLWCVLLTGISQRVTGAKNGLLRAVELPFLFGMGARYGNYVKMAVGMVLIVLTVNHGLYGKGFRWGTFDGIMNSISGFFAKRLTDVAMLVWGLLIAGSLALLYVSYYLSCLWYRRRMRQ